MGGIWRASITMWRCSRKQVFGVVIIVLIAFGVVVYLLPRSPLDYNYFNQVGDNGDSSGWFRRSSSENVTVNDDSKCALKVYMYDLPRKFNMGLLLNKDPDPELPWTDSDVPPWPMNFALNVQHSVEYWLMVYLLNSRNRTDGQMAAISVNDPTQADVFFVPFFSARLFNQHGHNMTGEAAAFDEKLQKDVVDILHKSEWWQRYEGRDHVIVAHHPNAFRFFRDMLNQSIFILADFGRMNSKVARLSKDVVAPYAHVLPSFELDTSSDPFSARKTLLFFQGRLKRKDGGWVRARLAQMLADNTDVQIEEGAAVSAEATEATTKGMRNSRFCLHPAGDTPSSCRLFDVIVNHCVPVIISDKIELPFEDDLDYNGFALFISSEKAIQPDYLLKTLREYKKEEWLTKWERLKRISHHFEYQHPAKKDDAVDMIFKQVQRKMPAVKLDIHRSKRLQIPDWWRRRR